MGLDETVTVETAINTSRQPAFYVQRRARAVRRLLVID